MTAIVEVLPAGVSRHLDGVAAMGAIELAAERSDIDVAVIVDAVLAAYTGHAAESLGYECETEGQTAWQLCCGDYLAEVQLWSTRASRRRIVSALRAADMAVVDIAAVVRVSSRTVERDLVEARNTSDTSVAVNESEPDEGQPRLPEWMRAVNQASAWVLRNRDPRWSQAAIGRRLGLKQVPVHRLLRDADRRLGPDGEGDLAALEAIAARVGEDVDQIGWQEACAALGYGGAAPEMVTREAAYRRRVHSMARQARQHIELVAEVEAGLDEAATAGQRQVVRDVLPVLADAQRRVLELHVKCGIPCPQLAADGSCPWEGVCPQWRPDGPCRWAAR